MATIGAARHEPLRIVLRYDSVHIERFRRRPVVLTGLQSRLVTEVGLAGLPVGWRGIAADLWPDAEDDVKRRRAWDSTTRRLRKTLRDHGIRTDLIRPDGAGNVELVLEPGDQVVDQA